MSHCVFTDDASADIQQIYEYIAELNPESALGVVERIEEACYLLADYPYIGTARPEFGEAHRSFTMPRSRYVIIYRPIEDGVEILNVKHSSQDIVRMLQQ